MSKVHAVSHWWNQIGEPEPSDVLQGPLTCDVAIVGAGFTGMWTAYYLKKLDPSLDIRIIEARFAGFGASGRNGGWLTNTITGGHEWYLKKFGVEETKRFQLAMNDTVAEVIRVAETEGIDADIFKGGSLMVARTPAAMQRTNTVFESALPEEGWQRLSAKESQQHINISETLGGLWLPDCARIHPAKLASGLANVLRKMGVRIHEGTIASQIIPGREPDDPIGPGPKLPTVVTEQGEVQAQVVLRATEGFTTLLKGLKRQWLPLNSSMIVTEEIPENLWKEIGWAGYDTVEDAAHIYSYAQRTKDNRIAIGGRGKPYRFGSEVNASGDIAPETVEQLSNVVKTWFPALSDIGIDYGWSGVLGVPRTWRATLGLHSGSGMAWAGGYVGTGVAATNLAGRTMADLIAGRDTELTTLPWVNQEARFWEPEPLRWIGIQSVYLGYRLADKSESAGGDKTSVFAKLANFIAGR